MISGLNYVQLRATSVCVTHTHFELSNFFWHYLKFGIQIFQILGLPLATGDLLERLGTGKGREERKHEKGT